MTILDKVQIGNKVKVNLDSSSERLSQGTIDTLKNSSIGTIRDFRITDGKGIGVILRLSNGEEQWFFENEIDILDEAGNVIDTSITYNENNNFTQNIFKDIKYANKNSVKDLINPFNFFIWLIVSFKDIF
tara:strand:- start:29 stop:418 length:390 start_codon:yes stop_codon:yes gene_type:complete